jgi:hypothetical protein
MGKTPLAYLKLNFDGATKGNPRPTGAGGVFKNYNGGILFLFANYLGRSTNNVVEFDGLIKRLLLTIDLKYHSLVVEGDSTSLSKPSQGFDVALIQIRSHLTGGYPQDWLIQPFFLVTFGPSLPLMFTKKKMV